MISIFYLIICYITGSVLCRAVFGVHGKKDCLLGISDGSLLGFDGTGTGVSSAYLTIPLSFISGIIFCTWLVYIMSCLCAGSEGALSRGLMWGISILLPADVVCLIRRFKRDRRIELPGLPSRSETVFFTVLTLFVLLLMWTSLSADGDTLYVGLSVFSDFTPHISMIRSFSFGDNFPTAYSVCAGADIKYHFMFEFLSAVLECGGLRIDHAFNIPSILCLLSMFSLLYAFTVKFTGKRLTGFLAVILLTFRSSLSFFIFLADKPSGVSLFEYLKTNTEFLGSTPNENWGLWNLNVYCNQRHLSLGICVIIVLITVFMPLIYEQFERLRDVRGPKKLIASSLFDHDSFDMHEPLCALAAGILLGATSFWNGACVIACLIILFFMAVVSDHRSDLLLTAGTALLLSLIQSSVFVDGSAVSPSYYYGFLTENPGVFSSTAFIVKLLGILPILCLVIFVMARARERWIMFAFSAPIIFAFTVSLTPDIAVNHKYIMIAVMFLDVFAAAFIESLVGRRDGRLKTFAVQLMIIMTVSGVYDTYILLKRNSPDNAVSVPLKSSITEWIKDNCSADDLFCTSNYYICGDEGSSVIMGGAMLYDAWQYFGWSAGYDTDFRDMIVSMVYGARSRAELRAAVSEAGFDYIIVDASNRMAEGYQLNEDLIASTYNAVFTTGIDEYRFTVYSTK